MVRALAVAVLVSSAAAAQEAPAPAGQRLTLEAAVQLALQRNPELRKQALLTLSSEQEQVLARATILPQLNFNASLGRNRNNGPVLVQGATVPETIQGTTFKNNFTAGLTLRQLVFDGGKWWNTLSAAGLTLDSSRAQVDEERLQITYLVEQRFYELVRAQRQLLVLADAAARSRDQADFTQRLFDGGRATQADVYAARANRDNDEIQRLGQERSVELARADLALAVGADPSEPLTVAEPLNLMTEPSQPPAAQAAIAQALSSRPSLKAFALSAEASRKSTAAAKGDYWPAVSLFGQWQRGTTSFSRVL